MVRARAFSSASRSGSNPVSALTRVDFPWSTCPAVPMTNGRIGGIVAVCESLAPGRVIDVNQSLGVPPAKNHLPLGPLKFKLFKPFKLFRFFDQLAAHLWYPATRDSARMAIRYSPPLPARQERGSGVRAGVKDT